MKKLVVDNLSCRRGDRLVFEDVSFNAIAGEATMLTGPNGAGKTTLLRVIAGLLRPANGTVRAEGLVENDNFIGAAIHFIGPLDALKPSLTVDENLRFWQRYLAAHDTSGSNSTEGEARRHAACDTLDLAQLADIPAGFLSTGQRRRLALARLLAVERPFWLLDEPTLGLDTASQVALSGMITEHVNDGGLAIVATHADLNLDEVRNSVRRLHLNSSVPEPII